MLECRYQSTCSGCEFIEIEDDRQRELKLADFQNCWHAGMASLDVTPELPELKFVTIASGGLRDRADLILQSLPNGASRIGLFDRDRSEILDLECCPQMSPALSSWYHDFRKLSLRLGEQDSGGRGSVRLRVSPTGRRGVWLDLANLDIKRLLDERASFAALREMATVEIGQKRKRLIEVAGRLKLGDPVLEPWFETYFESDFESDTQSKIIPLYCTIGSFTQPGFVANRALVGTTLSLLRDKPRERILEFGSGIGNFTLPLAHVSGEVHVFEIDSLALEGLSRSAIEQDLTNKIHVHRGNFQLNQTQIEWRAQDLIFVDPPRSGLMKFLDPLEALKPESRPNEIIYVSCFAESFAKDCSRLDRFGYKLQSLTIIDQFPQSRHYEIVAHLEKVRLQ